MKAWATRDRVDPKRFQPYLTRIVINECRNIQRQRMQVQPMAELPETERHLPTGGNGARGSHCPAAGEPAHPLLLRYMENFSEKETAQALGLSVTAVKNRLFRARRA